MHFMSTFELSNDDWLNNFTSILCPFLDICFKQFYWNLNSWISFNCIKDSAGPVSNSIATFLFSIYRGIMYLLGIFDLITFISHRLSLLVTESPI